MGRNGWHAMLKDAVGPSQCAKGRLGGDGFGLAPSDLAAAFGVAFVFVLAGGVYTVAMKSQSTAEEVVVKGLTVATELTKVGARTTEEVAGKGQIVATELIEAGERNTRTMFSSVSLTSIPNPLFNVLCEDRLNGRQIRVKAFVYTRAARHIQRKWRSRLVAGRTKDKRRSIRAAATVAGQTSQQRREVTEASQGPEANIWLW